MFTPLPKISMTNQGKIPPQEPVRFFGLQSIGEGSPVVWVLLFQKVAVESLPAGEGFPMAAQITPLVVPCVHSLYL